MAAAVLLDNDAQRIGALFLMNLVTAAMDVAVDGLAIDILDSDTEIGWGNVAQVVGFKTGMLTGGAFLLYVAGTSWSHCFGVMAVIALLATVGSFFVLLAGFSGNSVARIKSVPKEKFSVSTILKELWKTTVAGKQLWVLLAVFVYKSGEVVGDRMFKLFLFDINKFSPEEIAFWNSVVGMIFSIVGSTAGGKVVGEVGAVASVRLLAILSLMAQLVRYLVIVVPQLQVLSVIVSLVAFENLVGGALTVVMFAFMMDSVNRRIGASHFTMLATIEVWGKSIPSLLSGLLADRLGYAFTFLLNCGFSAFFVFVSFRLKQRQRLRAGNKQK
jgi:MFS family permease